jgi:DNA-binding IscR family transcriptional regulator
MKIVRDKDSGTEDVQLISLKIKKRILVALDEIAETQGVSRQFLMNTILDQVLQDKTFVLKLP